ncbi:hypothetical protein BU17DRAFT_66195 [Hysterangium stoloniferum]|nr:hypothetical protein BU17DRAFT_66195 [Hysterangium stoloniferum]
MCIGNRAASSAYYINKQIEILWELSNECVKKHGYGIRPSRTEIEYGSCLSQVCIGKHKQVQPSHKDLSFFASFGAAPQIKFICNHEVVLILHINTGHYKPEGKPTADAFEGYTCSFRVPFREHTITDNAYATFGQTAICKAKLIILDLNNAVPLRDHYFDNLSRTHLIDYSTLCDIEIETDAIYGINIDAINKFLAGRWLEATALIDRLSHGYEYHDHDKVTGKYALAEHRAVCEDIHFRAFFGPPQLGVRCDKEVVFTIDIEELHFFLEGGFESEISHKISNWKISFIVEAILVEEEEESRYCEALSRCASETIERNILNKIRNVFIQYITQRYLFILEEYCYNYVYYVDIRVEECHSDDECFSDEESYGVPCGPLSKPSYDFCERLTITEVYNCDTITAVSQGSINNHFRSLWKASLAKNGCLSSWSYDEHFDASFGPLQMQFPVDPCSHTVILYINLLQGYLTNMGVDGVILHGDTYEFQGWRLAFEVDLTLREGRDAHKSFIKNVQSGSEWTHQQLVLDFKTAKIRFDLSRLAEIHECANSSAARARLGALLHYIAHCYFAQLESENFHILYSIPVLRDSRCLDVALRYAPRTIDFQFLPAPYGEERKYVSCLFGHQRNYGDRNMLIICGMFCDEKLPPLPIPSGSWRWSICEERFSGVVALSRQTFLEGWLLCELEKINERTTIVPHFHYIGDEGAWKIEFPVWTPRAPESATGIGSESVQKVFNINGSIMMTGPIATKVISVTSTMEDTRFPVRKTTNTLTLPTVNQRGICKIKIEGKVELTLSFSGNGKQWSTSSTVDWSTSIVICNAANACGLEFSKVESINIPKSTGFHGDTELIHKDFKDATSILRDGLPAQNLVKEETISTLVKLFSDVWPTFQSGAYGYTLTNPTFNICGDLLLELAPPLDRNGCIIVSKPESHGITLFDGVAGKSRYRKNTITNTVSDSFSSPTANHFSSHAMHVSKSNGAHEVVQSKDAREGVQNNGAHEVVQSVSGSQKKKSSKKSEDLTPKATAPVAS